MLYNFRESFEYRLNALYTILQGLYWMIVCCTISMGSAYLSNRGYSTVGIGLLFAMAYLFATIFQQVISSLADKSTSFDVVDVLAVLSALMVVIEIFAATSDGKSFGTGFTFFLGAMVATVIQPFLNSLNFHIEKFGVEMNYGAARASGSFFFFLMSLIAGFFMKVTSEKAAPILGFFVSVLFVLTITLIYGSLKETGIDPTKSYDPLDSKNSENTYDLKTIKKFINQYRMFFVVLVGIVCFFFGHVLINNFMFQITTNVGGDEGDLGGLLAMQAIVELPAMIFFNKLRERYGCRFLLGLSAVFYFVKIFMTAIAGSVGMLYFSMLFQALAFAVFIPASVHLVEELMSQKDAIKGQAFLTISMTLSNLLSSLLGGVLIRIMGVRASLWFGTLVTLWGVIVAIFGLIKIKEK